MKFKNSDHTDDLLAFLKPVAGAIHLQDLSVVGELLQKRPRKSLRFQNPCSLNQGKIKVALPAEHSDS